MDKFTSILYEALAQPIGLLLAAPERDKVRQKLYQARAKAQDPALDILQIRVSPIEGGDLVICKSGTLQLQAQAQASKSESIE